MILYDHANAKLSFIERCLCHCSPKKRAPSGIADVPEIANRSGVFFQYGDHSTANTAMTLKGAVFDKGNRVADLKAYGGFGGEASTVGAWTAEKSSTWLCLMTIARLCNYLATTPAGSNSRKIGNEPTLKSGKIFAVSLGRRAAANRGSPSQISGLNSKRYRQKIAVGGPITLDSKLFAWGGWTNEEVI
jgi:hypothetical protein